jgi:DNA-binding CsgD family transcriptional regulator
MPHLVGESPPSLAKNAEHAALPALSVVAATVLAPAVLAFDAAGRLLHRSASAAALLNALADAGELASGERRLERDALPDVVTTAVAHSADARAQTVFGRDGRVYVLQTMAAVAHAGGEESAPRTYVVIAPTSDTTSLAERYGLSPREHEMVRRIARGDANKAIAAALGLSAHTVQEYVGRACRKVGVRTRRELVARLLGG